jgi:hypothetical protein
MSKAPEDARDDVVHIEMRRHGLGTVRVNGFLVPNVRSLQYSAEAGEANTLILVLTPPRVTIDSDETSVLKKSAS